MEFTNIMNAVNSSKKRRTNINDLKKLEIDEKNRIKLRTFHELNYNSIDQNYEYSVNEFQRVLQQQKIVQLFRRITIRFMHCSI